MSKTKLLLPLTALLIAILVIAACGGNTPSPSTEEGQGDGDPLPTHQPGESEWSPPTGEGDAPTPIPPAPEQPWPQPDLQTPLPILPSDTPTPVPTPEFDPAAYFAQSDPTGRNPWRTDFSKHSIDYSEILLGQVRDGIPSIDNPKFAPVSDDPDWLADREPVIALQIGDDARAYPLQIMTWHEIVNDIVGGEPRHRHLLPPLQLRHRLRTPHGRHRQLLRRQRPPPLQRPHHVRPRQPTAGGSRFSARLSSAS